MMELSSFLATRAAARDTTQVISTHHSVVLCVQPRGVSVTGTPLFESCSMWKMPRNNGVNTYNVAVRSIDTNVVLLAVTLAQRFVNVPCMHWVRHSQSLGVTLWKKTAWGTWKAYDEVTPTLCAFNDTPESTEDSLQPPECVNQARKKLFTMKHATGSPSPTKGCTPD